MNDGAKRAIETFSYPHPDACWIEGAPIARIVGVAVDFVEFVLTYIYRRTR